MRLHRTLKITQRLIDFYTINKSTMTYYLKSMVFTINFSPITAQIQKIYQLH